MSALDINSGINSDDINSSVNNYGTGSTYDSSTYDSSTYDSSTNSSISGGDIKILRGTYNNLFKYIALALLVLFVLYITYKFFNMLMYNGEDYYQRQTHKYFDNLHGEALDDDAKNTIEYGESITKPRAIDHYRIGTTYLVNAKNPVRAHAHFMQALQQVINGEVDMKEVPFIIDRIDDYKDMFLDFPEIEELPIQQALMAHFEEKTNTIRNITRIKNNGVSHGGVSRGGVSHNGAPHNGAPHNGAPHNGISNSDDPEFIQKVLLSRQDWKSDSQNVHDTAIYSELEMQFKKVRDENANNKNLINKDYHDAVDWLKIRYKDDAINTAKLNKVLSFLNNDYPIGNMVGVKERDIITAVWQRAYDPENKEKLNDIKEALGDAILDCVEGNTVVCMSGRTSKIWQALAKQDKDPEIGILKSKQAIRNEIYERSAKIVNDHVGIDGTASDQLKESYKRGDNCEQVKELTECMRQQIDELRNEYNNRLPHDQLNLIIEECKAVV